MEGSRIAPGSITGEFHDKAPQAARSSTECRTSATRCAPPTTAAARAGYRPPRSQAREHLPRQASVLQDEPPSPGEDPHDFGIAKIVAEVKTARRARRAASAGVRRCSMAPEQADRGRTANHHAGGGRVVARADRVPAADRAVLLEGGVEQEVGDADDGLFNEARSCRRPARWRSGACGGAGTLRSARSRRGSTGGFEPREAWCGHLRMRAPFQDAAREAVRRSGAILRGVAGGG